MKIEQLKKRLIRNRPTKAISIRIPNDVIDNLKRLASLRGFSTPGALARAYIGQGLRADLERFENNSTAALVEGLRKRGVSEKVIKDALRESVQP